MQKLVNPSLLKIVDIPIIKKKKDSYFISLEIFPIFLKYMKIVIAAIIILAMLKNVLIVLRPSISNPAGFRNVKKAKVMNVNSIRFIIFSYIQEKNYK